MTEQSPPVESRVADCRQLIFPNYWDNDFIYRIFSATWDDEKTGGCAGLKCLGLHQSKELLLLVILSVIPKEC
jgi:hypothetical protein